MEVSHVVNRSYAIQLGRVLGMIICLGLCFHSAAATATETLQFDSNKVHPDVKQYECYRLMELGTTKANASFSSETGMTVLSRSKNGFAKLKIRVLADNASNDVRVYGDFNGWKRDQAIKLSAEQGTPYFSGIIEKIQHGSQYRIILNGNDVLDPSASMFSTPEINRRFGRSDDTLNSVFWDMEGADKPKRSVRAPDLRGKPVALGEQELYELVRNWNYKGQRGPRTPDLTYKFVAESGIIPYLKEQGYNAFEFLPFNESMDGAHWSLHYQVFGLFGPTSRYGTPTEFAEMINSFNEKGILVIMDAVVGHFPFQGNQGVRNIAPIGIHQWKKADGQNLFGSNLSPWGTYRYDYQNPYVRRFLIDSIMTMLKTYNVGGIRFDNYDGIRFEAGGTIFLRELSQELRRVSPEAFTIAEMFFGESKVTERIDNDGFGVNARTHSDFFDFVKDFAQKRTEDINMNTLRNAIRNPWGWREAARVLYITNHDEAANGRDGATGSYFPTLIEGGWYYESNKTKVFTSLAMLSSSFYMDMPQLRLGQRGNFNSNSATDWDLSTDPQHSKLEAYSRALTRYFTSNTAFAFHNQTGEIENHTDYENKIISFQRYNPETGKKVIVLVNLSHRGFDHYQFGVDFQGELKLALTSDAPEFGGNGDVGRTISSGVIGTTDQGMHGKQHSLNVPFLPPFGVMIFEK